MEKVIKLSNGRKYIVCNNVSFKNRKFYQLMDIKNAETLIVEVVDGNLLIVKDEDLQVVILSEMVKKLTDKK